MLVERINAHYERLAASRVTRERRASAYNIGGCSRALWYDVHGVPGEPMDGEGIRRMEVGDATEGLVWRWLTEAGVKHAPAGPEDTVTLEGIGRVRADAFLDEPGMPRILEIKRMGAYPFEKAQRGELDPKYLGQVECYARAYDEPSVLVLCVSDSGDLHALVVERDDERWAQLLANREAAHGEEPPARPYVAEETCSSCDGTGKTKARGWACKPCGGKGKTDPMVPSYPCGWCPQRLACWEDVGKLEPIEVTGAWGKTKTRLRIVREVSVG